MTNLLKNDVIPNSKKVIFAQLLNELSHKKIKDRFTYFSLYKLILV